MKTAETIETSEERKEQQRGVQAGAKRGPYKKRKDLSDLSPTRQARAADRTARQASLDAIKPFSWKPGQSGNPTGHAGKPKADVAHQIARAVFENNTDALYQTFAKALLKGNAYAFTQLADRAYGKIADKLEFTPGAEFKDETTEALSERVKFLERKLGVTISADDARGTGINPVRDIPAHFPKED